MKILLAFALVASAAALVPSPVALPAAPEPAFHDAPEDVQAAHKLAQISIEPLIIPASIYKDVEQVRVADVNFDQAIPETVQFVDSADFVHPLAYGELPEEFHGEPVQFADSDDFVHPFAYAAVPAEFEAAEEVAEEIEPSPVDFAENLAVAADSEAIEVPAVSYVEPEVAEVVADAEEIDPSPVNFVNFAEVAEAPTAVADDVMAVNFVDFAEIAEAPAAEDVMAVNFVDVAEDAPVPEPISFDAFAQEVAAEDDTPQEIPYGKLYDNPMLR